MFESDLGLLLGSFLFGRFPYHPVRSLIFTLCVASFYPMNFNIPLLINALFSLACGVGVTVYAFRGVGSSDGDKAKAGLRKRVRWLGPLVIMSSMFLLREARLPDKLTPEAVVDAMRSKTAFPLQIDEVTQLGSVEANRDRVVFVFAISKPVSSRSEKEALGMALKSKVRTSVCADKQMLAILDAGISLEYIYFAGGNMLPSILLSKADCVRG